MEIQVIADLGGGFIPLSVIIALSVLSLKYRS
jgi:hypothetical protein